MAKSYKTYHHLRNIIDVLQGGVGVGLLEASLRNAISGEQGSSLTKRKSSENLDFSRHNLGTGSSGFASSSLSVVK